MDQGFDFYAPDIYITGWKKNSVCVDVRMEEEEEKLFGAGESSIHCMTLPREFLSKRRTVSASVPELEKSLLHKILSRKDKVEK